MLWRRRACLLLCLGSVGCIGPGLEPPKDRAADHGPSTRDAGAEPVGEPPNTTEGGGTAIDGDHADAGSEEDAGLENPDAASDSR